MYRAGVNDAETVKRWASSVDAVVVKQTSVHRFLGGSESVVDYQGTLAKEAGDRVRTLLRALPSGEGVTGYEVLEGNEDSPSFYTEDITLGQFRYAVRVPWRNIDQQRVPFNIREQGRAMVTDFITDRIDDIFFRQLCADTVVEATALNEKFNGFNTIASYASSRHWIGADGGSAFGGSDAEGSLNSGADELTLATIDNVLLQVKTADIPLRPAKVKGDEAFFVFMPPKVTLDLRADNGTTGWHTLYNNALQGGWIKENPLFTGALGYYNGVLFIENTRVRPAINGGAYVDNEWRLPFVGAQSMCMCYGRFGGRFEDGKYSWVEETFDYENELGIAVSFIFGMKRTKYDSTDYGSFLISVADSDAPAA